ncbi:hypothetical protein D3C73_1166940 [compost metagenome]
MPADPRRDLRLSTVHVQTAGALITWHAYGSAAPFLLTDIPWYDRNRLPDLAQAGWQGQFPSPIHGTVPQQMTTLIILICSRVQPVPPPWALRADSHITDQDTPCSKSRWQINQGPPGSRPCCYLASVIGPVGMSAKCYMTFIGDNL